MMKKRILLIDDEPGLRLLVQTYMETVGGWEVLAASAGEQGLAIATAQKVDAIVVDMMMPEMDGITFLQKLQNNPTTQTIPVIFFTGKANRADLENYEHLGAVGAIAKPFNPPELIPLIAKMLGW